MVGYTTHYYELYNSLLWVIRPIIMGYRIKHTTRENQQSQNKQTYSKEQKKEPEASLLPALNHTLYDDK